MKLIVRRAVKKVLPGWLRRIATVAFGWRWFGKSYKSWASAAARSGGYDSLAILNKVIAATSQVEAGAAAFERDSVLFDKPAFETELITILLRIADENDGCLRVLDFGGSLGSIYRQHRAQFRTLKELHWDVVEQPHFVAAGRERFQNKLLRFFPTILEAERDLSHDVWLASGVIQYLPRPHELMTEWVQYGPRTILLHNVPLHDSKPDTIRIQRVPPEIYPASYPVWFFNRSRFLERFAERYELEYTYASTAIWRVGWKNYPSTGLFFRRRSDQQ